MLVYQSSRDKSRPLSGFTKTIRILSKFSATRIPLCRVGWLTPRIRSRLLLHLPRPLRGLSRYQCHDLATSYLLSQSQLSWSYNCGWNCGGRPLELCVRALEPPSFTPATQSIKFVFSAPATHDRRLANRSV